MTGTVSSIPEVKTISGKKLVGQRLRMSYSDNKTVELWRNFMPKLQTIKHRINSELISMQVYDPGTDPTVFNPHMSFEKWAAVEVHENTDIPEGMETTGIPEGTYAVFIHKGAAETAAQTFGYIFGDWLPRSGFVTDQRPQFEVLGPKYKNHDPDSEEEIWIPVKYK